MPIASKRYWRSWQTSKNNWRISNIMTGVINKVWICLFVGKSRNRWNRLRHLKEIILAQGKKQRARQSRFQLRPKLKKIRLTSFRLALILNQQRSQVNRPIRLTPSQNNQNIPSILSRKGQINQLKDSSRQNLYKIWDRLMRKSLIESLQLRLVSCTKGTWITWDTIQML